MIIRVYVVKDSDYFSWLYLLFKEEINLWKWYNSSCSFAFPVYLLYWFPFVFYRDQMD